MVENESTDGKLLYVLYQSENTNLRKIVLFLFWNSINLCENPTSAIILFLFLFYFRTTLILQF